MSEHSQNTAINTYAQTIHLLDLSADQALFPDWHGFFTQISRGHFQGRLLVARGHLVRLMNIFGNQRILVQGNDRAKLFSVYPVTEKNAESLWQGRRLRPGQFVVHGPDCEINHYSARHSEYLGLSLRPDELRLIAYSLLGGREIEVIQTWSTYVSPSGQINRWHSKCRDLLNEYIANPLPLQTSQGLSLERECARCTVDILFAQNSVPEIPPEPVRSRLLARAEDYLRAHLVDAVSAVDLCQELGVSDRTLRLMFRERYGLGPMAYWQSLRLNAVRARLRATSHGTIAAAANEFGFHHLGNFCAQYRRQFGEVPSQTERPGQACTPIAEG